MNNIITDPGDEVESVKKVVIGIYTSPVTRQKEELEILNETDMYYKARPVGLKCNGVRVLKKYIQIKL